MEPSFHRFPAGPRTEILGQRGAGGGSEIESQGEKGRITLIHRRLPTIAHTLKDYGEKLKKLHPCPLDHCLNSSPLTEKSSS